MKEARSRKKSQKKAEEAKEEPEQLDLEADFIPLDDNQDSNEPKLERENQNSFFGKLDRSELEYFKNAEEMLSTNALSTGEKSVFLENVYTEAQGKELKLATNQVCSKLIERLVYLANDEQAQKIATAFEPFCLDLAYHKYSSHCLEAVLGKCMTIPDCEGLLKSMADKLGEHCLEIAADPYASHVMCMVLYSLSGVRDESRSKRSQLIRKYTEIGTEREESLKKVEISPSQELKSTARSIIDKCSEELDTAEARRMATNQTGSIVLQALIKCEATLSSNYTLLNTVFDKSSSGFITHCLSDEIGSRFLETCVKIMPSKQVSKLTDNLPLEKIVKSEDAHGKYVLYALIVDSRLNKDAKRKIVNDYLLPEIPNSAPLALAALDIDFEEAAAILTTALDNGTISVLDSKKSKVFTKTAKYHPFVEKAVDQLLKLEDEQFKQICLDPTLSYTIQKFLDPSVPQISRRKLINKLVGIIPILVVNAVGSHIVDSLWFGCYKLKFGRERTAHELSKIEEEVKHSPYGAKVWKNWFMEKYLRKPNLWWDEVKKTEDELRASLEPEKHEQFKKSKTEGPQKKKRRS